MVRQDVQPSDGITEDGEARPQAETRLNQGIPGKNVRERSRQRNAEEKDLGFSPLCR
jgi:hypothetical protein